MFQNQFENNINWENPLIEHEERTRQNDVQVYDQKAKQQQINAHWIQHEPLKKNLIFQFCIFIAASLISKQTISLTDASIISDKLFVLIVWISSSTANYKLSEFSVGTRRLPFAGFCYHFQYEKRPIRKRMKNLFSKVFSFGSTLLPKRERRREIKNDFSCSYSW